MKIISLGAGVQSSTMLLMALEGEFESKPDCAIFADTQDEPAEVYAQLKYLKERSGDFPIYTVTKGKLSDSVLSLVDRFISIPTYGDRGGMGRRQCTREFKITPINKKCRELFGAVKYQRIPINSVQMWIGISLDEVQRMKHNRERWIENRWPLIEKRMTRHDCLLWLKKHGHPIPPKSACIFCPFHDNKTWQRMKDEQPNEFRKVIEIDRELNKRGEYLHRKLQPIDEISFVKKEESLFDNECEGICGV